MYLFCFSVSSCRRFLPGRPQSYKDNPFRLTATPFRPKNTPPLHDTKNGSLRPLRITPVICVSLPKYDKVIYLYKHAPYKMVYAKYRIA